MIESNSVAALARRRKTAYSPKRHLFEAARHAQHLGPITRFLILFGYNFKVRERSAIFCRKIWVYVGVFGKLTKAALQQRGIHVAAVRVGAGD